MNLEDKEDLRRQLFTVEATRIAAQVQHACALASGLDEPAIGFDVLMSLLHTCLDEVARYEARMRNEVAFTPEEEGKDDGGN